MAHSHPLLVARTCHLRLIHLLASLCSTDSDPERKCTRLPLILSAHVCPGDEDWWVDEQPVLNLQLVGMRKHTPAEPVAAPPEAIRQTNKAEAPRLVKLEGSQTHPMFGDLPFEMIFTSYNKGDIVTLKQVSCIVPRRHSLYFYLAIRCSLTDQSVSCPDQSGTIR